MATPLRIIGGAGVPVFAARSDDCSPPEDSSFSEVRVTAIKLD